MDKVQLLQCICITSCQFLPTHSVTVSNAQTVQTFTCWNHITTFWLVHTLQSLQTQHVIVIHVARPLYSFPKRGLGTRLVHSFMLLGRDSPSASNSQQIDAYEIIRCVSASSLKVKGWWLWGDGSSTWGNFEPNCTPCEKKTVAGCRW